MKVKSIQSKLLEQNKYLVSEKATNIHDSESLSNTLKTFQESLT